MKRMEQQPKKLGLIKLFVDAVAAGTGLNLGEEDFELRNRIVRNADSRRQHIIDIVFGKKCLSTKGEEIFPQVRINRALDGGGVIIGGNVPLISSSGSRLRQEQVSFYISDMSQLVAAAEVSKTALSMREQLLALAEKRDRRT